MRNRSGVRGRNEDFLGSRVMISRGGVTSTGPVIAQACEDPMVRLVCRFYTNRLTHV